MSIDKPTCDLTPEDESWTQFEALLNARGQVINILPETHKTRPRLTIKELTYVDLFGRRDNPGNDRWNFSGKLTNNEHFHGSQDDPGNDIWSFSGRVKR